jgi:hypothetical protein
MVWSLKDSRSTASCIIKTHTGTLDSNPEYHSLRASNRTDRRIDGASVTRHDGTFRKQQRSKHRRILSTTAPVLSRVINHIKLIIFLMVVPVALIAALLNVHPAATFVLNLIATIPLSIVLTAATESLSHSLGPTIGALLNVSSGNLSEMTIL